MTETVKTFPFRRRAQREEDQDRQALLDSLARTQVQLNQAYALFNSAGDPDLIESYVFEINALQARYSYLLRRVKELEQEKGA